MPRRKHTQKQKSSFLHQPVALPVVVLTLLFIATLAASLVVARSHQSVLGTRDEHEIETVGAESPETHQERERAEAELRHEIEIRAAQQRQQTETKHAEPKKLPEKPRELPKPSLRPIDPEHESEPVLGKVKDQPKKLDLTANEVEVKFEYEDNHLKLKAKTEDGTELELEEEALSDIQNRLSQDFTHIATTSGSQLFVINKGQNGAITQLPISVELSTNTLKVTTPQGTKEVATLPDQAVQNLINHKVVTKIQEKTSLPGDTSTEPLKQMLELKDYNGTLAYHVAGVSQQRFLGLIPVNIDKQVVVSAESGKVLHQDITFLGRFLDFLSL